MTVPVTGLAAAIIALMLLFTAFQTVKARLRNEISFGDGDSPDLRVARGIHANLAEYAPIFLILLAILELANANHWGITIVAAIFLIGRALHIVGMGQHSRGGSPKLRQFGILATWGSILTLALWIIWIFVTQNL